jgi:hypothetical protein
MSNERANRISRRYYGQVLSDVPKEIKRQVVRITASTKGGIPHGLRIWSVFSYEEIMRAESIINELDPQMLAQIR